MELVLTYLKVFATGGIICGIGQILIDKTKLTPARILVVFVSAGVILTLLGIYPKIAEFGGAGATVPLTGFGFLLAKGVFKEIDSQGLIGIFTGGLKASSAGIAAAIFFGYLSSIAFKPQGKRL
jgi:stage V sporulation protein AE